MAGLPALYATNHVIKFGGTLGFAYSPSELNIVVGDTVTWEGSFSAHPLSSTSVPEGAAAFHNATGDKFSYAVMVPGTYDYQCDIHFSLGMIGSFTAIVSGLEDDASTVVPDVFKLDQNFPNPFNPVTTIGYDIPRASNVILNVYNVLGEKIATLVSARQPAGHYEVRWNAGNTPSGIYYYQITADGFTNVKRMILIR
jgi:plastocyanin